MTTESLLPLLAVAVSAVAVVPILLSGARPNRREAWTFAAALVKFGVVLALLPGVLRGVTYASPGIAFVPGVRLVLRVDALGALFALLASGLWLVTSLYSVGYVRSLDEAHQTGYFAAFAASLSATVGVAFAGNLLTLFVFYELLTVATYPLVVHKRTAEAWRAGRTYVVYTLAGGVAILAGTVLVYAVAGTTTFAPGGLAGVLAADPLVGRVAFALLVAGFGVKAALFPLHGWLPEAMVAPTPVSGLLHAVAVVKSGAFGIARVVLYVFGPDGVRTFGVGVPLAVVAAVTMVLAAALALRQDRLKRGLAYSTVSQLSYIVLGLAVLTPTAVQGALLHLSAHALMKLVLFFCAGVVYCETHVERIDELAGIGRRLPATMTLFAVASAGLVGFPLVAGFVSKWYLLTGLFAGGDLVLAGLLLLAGLLKLLFFWPIVSAAFFAESGAERGPTRASLSADGGHDGDAVHDWEPRTWRTETDWQLLLPVAVALALAVVYGVVPTELPFYELATRVAEVTAG
ncbi:proton-conducting transporter transmembrane domain-containing protein [Haloarchaeobius baliensis]|uniref:proton-conducting transporter transmembrane domain-containing protein n=1 Tax=Haloarchaeobius baliensis TaxID=1670458 RepID=UPI003F884E40